MTNTSGAPVRSPEGLRFDQALTQAVRQEMAKHKLLRQPIAVWRDGKAVWLPAEEIPVGIEEYELPLSRPPTDEDTLR